ncbi:MAG TPA: SMP-30/gluconolactonase/LRE family protein [Candidatus Paceibacterota bacterium]|nr:SMP-30/gluconolactonase/LRE family protein [Candidatus Paceibacterota bacterium]
MLKDLRTVLTGLAFPEAMRWHNGELWFSDVLAGKVFRADIDTGRYFEVVSIPPVVSGLGWLSNGDLLAVDCEARQVISIDSAGAKKVYVDLSETWQYPANDMLVDEDGTAWIGGYGFNPETESPKESFLARYKGGVLDFPIDSLVFPNGMARLDANHLVVAETFADRLTIIETDSLGEVRIAKRITLPANSTPDGLTVDEEGNIWVASAYGEAVLLVDPVSGVVERAIEIRGRGVFDCVFGGTELRTLFIAVSDVDESKALVNLPGEVLAISLGVRGRQ